MSLELETATEPIRWVGNRNFIVPPDIVPVRRVSPIPAKKRTLCRPRPEGDPVCRSGDREWFSDQLFVESETYDFRTAYGGSMTVHASCLIGLLVLLAGQSDPTMPVRVSSPLGMPAFVAAVGDGGAGSAPWLTAVPERREPPAKGRVAESPKKSPTIAPPDRAPEAIPDNDQSNSAEEARTESHETAAQNPEDTQVGVPDGVTEGAGAAGETTGAGTGEGAGNGSAATGAGSGSSGIGRSVGPYRLGNGIEPPRKIKDVRPVYPAGAMSSRALGTVLIEAVVGADGKIHDAKVVHSIPLLDQAALDAVRQWEFAPSKLNGVAVAVIVTIQVQFSLY